MNAIALTNLQVGAFEILTQIAQIIVKVSAAVLLCCCVLLVPYYIKTLLLAKKDVDEKNSAAYDGWVSRYNLAHREFNEHQEHLYEVEELADQGFIIQSKYSDTESNKGKIFAFPTSLPDSQYPDNDRIHDMYGMEVVGEDDLSAAYGGESESIKPHVTSMFNIVDQGGHEVMSAEDVAAYYEDFGRVPFGVPYNAVEDPEEFGPVNRFDNDEEVLQLFFEKVDEMRTAGEDHLDFS